MAARGQRHHDQRRHRHRAAAPHPAVKLVRIDAKDGETIVNCEMSDDGTWLAYSTATRTR